MGLLMLMLTEDTVCCCKVPAVSTCCLHVVFTSGFNVQTADVQHVKSTPNQTPSSGPVKLHNKSLPVFTSEEEYTISLLLADWYQA